jgi:uncharacterized protein YjiS (DUF1127 family)
MNAATAHLHERYSETAEARLIEAAAIVLQRHMHGREHDWTVCQSAFRHEIYARLDLLRCWFTITAEEGSGQRTLQDLLQTARYTKAPTPPEANDDDEIVRTVHPNNAADRSLPHADRPDDTAAGGSDHPPDATSSSPSAAFAPVSKPRPSAKERFKDPTHGRGHLAEMSKRLLDDIMIDGVRLGDHTSNTLWTAGRNDMFKARLAFQVAEQCKGEPNRPVREFYDTKDVLQDLQNDINKIKEEVGV